MLRNRSCCVFSAPDRDVICASSFEEAQKRSREHCRKGVSKQAFAIFPKVLEVDEVLRTSGSNNVIEVHPEICFCRIAGSPLLESKRRADGFDRRKSLLEAQLGSNILSRADVRKIVRAKPDDYLDALVAALVAMRHSQGKANRMPTDEVDEFGLLMQMWF
jgi:predicted RNase H-like nuclease